MPRIRKRLLLSLRTVILAFTVVAVACSPTPPTPTTAPVKPAAQPTAPAAPAPAAKPTTAPAAAPAPAAKPTTAPAAAAKPAAAQPTAAVNTAAKPPASAAAQPADYAMLPTDEYLKRREQCTKDKPCHPQVVTNAVPSKFAESPMLAAQVKDGKLPPVEQRLPKEPLVLQPAEGIGQYGGDLVRGFTGPGDRAGFQRWINDQSLYWDTGLTKVVPHLFKAWEVNDTATVFTFHLREGLKWSDGQPMTVDDYMFWYEDILQDKKLVRAVPWYMNWGGQLAKWEKVGENSLRMTYVEPFGAFPLYMASSQINGPFTLGRNGLGLYAPKHYLQQFHPKYVGEAEATKKATDAKFDDWSQNFLRRNDPTLNPETPIMGPWRPLTPITAEEFLFERNPFYWVVDTQGNQLPYIDRFVNRLGSNLEVINLRAIAGEYTFQDRHIDDSKLPVFIDNQDKGGYFLDYYLAESNQPAKIHMNQDYQNDKEIGDLLRKTEFRRAFSIAFDRNEINEAFFLGRGKEASFCPAGATPYFHTDKWDKEWAVLNKDEANKILDGLGLDKKDAEGYRLLPSGKRLSLRFDAVSASSIDYPGMGEMIARHLKQNVGLHMTINPVERSLWVTRLDANEVQVTSFGMPSYNPLLDRRIMPGDRWAPVAAEWASVPDPDPAKYDGPQYIKDMVALYYQALRERDDVKREQILTRATEVMCDNQSRLGTVAGVSSPNIMSKKLRNVGRPVEVVTYALTPNNAYPDTWFLVK